MAIKIEDSIRPLIENVGCELVHIQYLGEGSGSMLRVYIDKKEGVNLDDCQKISRQIGIQLDVEDLIPHRYTLEVSSLGLERPLFKASDYKKYTGKEIRVTTKEKLKDCRKFKGFLNNIVAETIELECNHDIIHIPLHNIRKANLVYRF